MRLLALRAEMSSPPAALSWVRLAAPVREMVVETKSVAVHGAHGHSFELACVGIAISGPCGLAAFGAFLAFAFSFAASSSFAALPLCLGRTPRNSSCAWVSWLRSFAIWALLSVPLLSDPGLRANANSLSDEDDDPWWKFRCCRTSGLTMP